MTKNDWLQICRLAMEYYFRCVMDDVTDEWIKEHMPTDDVFEDKVKFLQEHFKSENDLDYPSDYMFLKMFDMADAYLCESTGEGWTWKGALEYFKKHWSDEEFNDDYMGILKKEEE